MYSRRQGGLVSLTVLHGPMDRCWADGWVSTRSLMEAAWVPSPGAPTHTWQWWVPPESLAPRHPCLQLGHGHLVSKTLKPTKCLDICLYSIHGASSWSRPIAGMVERTAKCWRFWKPSRKIQQYGLLRRSPWEAQANRFPFPPVPGPLSAFIQSTISAMKYPSPQGSF